MRNKGVFPYLSARMNDPSKVVAAMGLPDSPTYQIYYNPVLASVVMEWQGYASSREFREGSEKMLTLLLENKASSVLADLTRMKLIALQDREWILQSFLPRLLAAGLRAIAFVRSHDYYNQLSIGTVVYEIEPSQLAVEYFYSVPEAESWLKSLG